MLSHLLDIKLVKFAHKNTLKITTLAHFFMSVLDLRDTLPADKPSAT